MSRLAIAAHVAIAGLALLAGYVGLSLQRFDCFYRNVQQIGAACADGELSSAAVQWFASTAAVLYSIWGIGFLVRRVLKQARGS